MPERRFWGKYRAQVTNNQDPDKMGRVKVKIPKLLGPDRESAWALPAFPPRFFGVPAVGDFVWIEFEGGDPDFPIYSLGFFPKSKVFEEAKTGYDEAGGAPGYYILRLPNGLLIELSDVQGKNHVLIKTPNGNQVLIDDETKKVYIESKGNIELKVQENLKADVSGNADINVSGTCNLNANQINLAGGGPPIARVGDAVTVTCPAGVGSGSIIGGSGKVTSS